MHRLLVAAGLALTACAGGAATDSGAAGDSAEVDPVTRVTEPGWYAVGYRTLEASYTLDDSGQERPLRLALWYPATGDDGTTGKYLDAFEAPDVLHDATPADSGPAPLLVYSHGHMGYAEASGRLMSHFASHGWVVLAPDHTGNTTFDGGDRDTAIYYQRAWDISAVVDLAQDGQLPDGLSAKLSGEVVAAGHSFGGYTIHGMAGATYDLDAHCADNPDHNACEGLTDDQAAIFEAGLEDDRLLAHISMAPGDWSLYRNAGFADIDAPVLHMTGGLDPSGGDNEAIWEALSASGFSSGFSGHRRLHLPDGGHQTFTDLSGILETFDGLIEAEEGDRIVRAHALAWAEAAVGRPAAWEAIDGGAGISDDAELMRP